jgi:hypothetical protein
MGSSLAVAPAAPPVIPVPTLSPSGWVTTIPEQVDAALAYFFASDYLQSAIYPNKVSSIQKVIQQYGDNILQLQRQMQLTLENYLESYFDNAIVDVNTDASTITGTSASLTIQATVSKNGLTYSVGKEITLSDSKFLKVITLNNTGAAF